MCRKMHIKKRKHAKVLLSRAAQNSVLVHVILLVTFSLCKSPLVLYLAILYSRKGKFVKSGDEEIPKL